jgi:hypothetical protein
MSAYNATVLVEFVSQVFQTLVSSAMVFLQNSFCLGGSVFHHVQMAQLSTIQPESAMVAGVNALVAINTTISCALLVLMDLLCLRTPVLPHVPLTI